MPEADELADVNVVALVGIVDMAVVMPSVLPVVLVRAVVYGKSLPLVVADDVPLVVAVALVVL